MWTTRQRECAFTLITLKAFDRHGATAHIAPAITGFRSPVGMNHIPGTTQGSNHMCRLFRLSSPIEHGHSRDSSTISSDSIIHEIGSLIGVLPIIALGASDLGVGVDEGLIDTSHPLPVPDVERILRAAIAGMLALPESSFLIRSIERRDFSIRRVEVKRFQTVCFLLSASIACGSALVFGISPSALPAWDQANEGSNLNSVLTASPRSIRVPARPHFIRRPARDIFPSGGGSGLFSFSAAR
jgi:hypothetical protein